MARSTWRQCTFFLRIGFLPKSYSLNLDALRDKRYIRKEIQYTCSSRAPPAQPLSYFTFRACTVGSAFTSIDRLASRLPFQLDDSKSVNALFCRVIHDGDARDVEQLEIWTYCFVWRYFTWKLVQNNAGSPADFEAIVTETFERVRLGRKQLSLESRYASWVSVVCRNTFLNFARRTAEVVFLEQRASDVLESDVPVRVHDPVLLRAAISEAVARLPQHLVECAQLYFLDGLDYEEMAKITGRTTATLRAYVHKAVRRLAEDEWLRAFRMYMNDEFFDE